MKKTFICFVIAAIQLTAYAQKLETLLAVGPRVGDPISVSCTFYQGDESKGHFSFTSQGSTQAGPFQIGPFTAFIDGKTYKTDSLVINTYPALPETKDGAWIRCIEQDGKTYITVDQRSTTLKTEKEYISLNKEAFTNAGIELHQTERMFVTFGSGELTLIYELKKTANFKKFQVTSSHFTNLPAGMQLETMWVK